MYRILWCTLAVAAAGTLVLSIMHPSVQPLIVGLRLLKAAIVITVAAILFRRRQRDAVAALLSLALLLWTITSSVDFASSTSALPAVLDRLRFLLFTVALLLFPSGDWRPRWARRIAVITVAVFAVGIAEALNWLPTRGFLPLAIPCVIAAIATLVVRFRTALREAERLQLKWVALGLVGGVGCILAARAGFALTARMTMPVAAPLLLEALFQSGIVLIALGFLVSLLRYRLFDVETVVTRSAAYGGLTLALLVIFAGSEALIETLGQSYFGMSFGNQAAAIAATIAAVVLTPLHHRAGAWAERYFQHDLVTLKNELPELLADLSVEASLSRFGETVLPRIAEAVHASRAILLIDGSPVATYAFELGAVRPASIGCDQSDTVYPVRIPMGCPAARIRVWLLLGPRPDGSLFGKDEIHAIAAITPALRRALAAVSAREAERARTSRLKRATVAKIQKLSARIYELERGRIASR